jgi:translation initiation factor IF-3
MIRRALDMAKEHGLDLVEIAPTAKPPVCRIMDFSKFKYDQEKKERRIKKNQKVMHLKQIRFNPNIDDHDYQIKLKQTIGFLSKKDKVKVNLFFRGREIMYKEQGKSILERIITDVSRYGQVEQSPMLEGKVMSVVFAPASDKGHVQDKDAESELAE